MKIVLSLKAAFCGMRGIRIGQIDQNHQSHQNHQFEWFCQSGISPANKRPLGGTRELYFTPLKGQTLHFVEQQYPKKTMELLFGGFCVLHMSYKKILATLKKSILAKKKKKKLGQKNFE